MNFEDESQTAKHKCSYTVISAVQVCDAIFLDFTKAFDKVPHHRLSLKLAGHGFNRRG